MRGRTCVLVTHALALFLPSCAYLVALEDGKVVYSGKPQSAPKHLLENAAEEMALSESHISIEAVSKADAAPESKALVNTGRREIIKREESRSKGASPSPSGVPELS